MRNLDDAIWNWRAHVARSPFVDEAGIDELEDHLRQEIERMTGEGMQPIAAFQIASESLGSFDSLDEEFRKITYKRVIAKRAVFCLGILFAVAISLNYLWLGALSISGLSRQLGDIGPYLLVLPILKILILIFICLAFVDHLRKKTGLHRSIFARPVTLAVFYGVVSIFVALPIASLSVAESVMHLVVHAIDTLVLWSLLAWLTQSRDYQLVRNAAK